MADYFKSVTLPPTNYSKIVSYFLVSVLIILIHFYLFGKNRKRLWSSNDKAEISKKTRSRKFPVVTYWFPFAVPFLDGILTLLRIYKNGIAILDECENKFGKIYWLPIGSQKFLVINDVNMVQNLLSSKNPLHLNKASELYDNIFIDWSKDGLVNSKFPVWSPHRKLLNHCFTYNSLKNYLKSINKHAKDLIKNWSNVVQKNALVREITDTNLINRSIHYHLVKITADIVIGPDSVSDDATAEYDKNLIGAMQSVFGPILIPLLRFPLFSYLFPKIKNQHKAIQYMDSFFKDITSKYRSKFEKELISKLDTQDSMDDDNGVKPHRGVIQEMLFQQATDKEVTDQLATFMFAGQKSTYIAIQMLMLHLALNPHHQFRCMAEIDELLKLKNNIKLNRLDNWNDLNLNFGDLANLKYLERCILESARITPTFPIFARTLEAPLKISDDFEFPSGTRVIVPIWMIHRDPDYFSNPEKFDPDRFLPDMVKNRHSYSYIPFSSGPRNCVAYKLAFMEIKVIMAWILMNFEIHSSDKLDNVKLLFEITIRPEGNYNIVLRQRQFS